MKGTMLLVLCLALATNHALGQDSGCLDLQFPVKPHCTGAGSFCEHALDEQDCGREEGCTWALGGQMGAWHERSGVGNTCAVMVQHGYCSAHYFNTFNNTRVTSAQACCGCGGGTTGTATEESCDVDNWPDSKDSCGACKVLVEHFKDTYETCRVYCAAVGGGRECVGAWAEGDDDCAERADVTSDCDDAYDSDSHICECGDLRLNTVDGTPVGEERAFHKWHGQLVQLEWRSCSSSTALVYVDTVDFSSEMADTSVCEDPRCFHELQNNTGAGLAFESVEELCEDDDCRGCDFCHTTTGEWISFTGVGSTYAAVGTDDAEFHVSIGAPPHGESHWNQDAPCFDHSTGAANDPLEIVSEGDAVVLELDPLDFDGQGCKDLAAGETAAIHGRFQIHPFVLEHVNFAIVTVDVVTSSGDELFCIEIDAKLPYPPGSCGSNGWGDDRDGHTKCDGTTGGPYAATHFYLSREGDDADECCKKVYPDQLSCGAHQWGADTDGYDKCPDNTEPFDRDDDRLDSHGDDQAACCEQDDDDGDDGDDDDHHDGGGGAGHCDMTHICGPGTIEKDGKCVASYQRCMDECKGERGNFAWTCEKQACGAAGLAAPVK